jgi:CRP/FNR family transcriptional regulator, anaerobic regulatory protein
MESVLENLNSIHPLSVELRKHLSQVLQVRRYFKKEFLLRAGNTCKFIYFMESGMVRCFYDIEKGDVSSWFMKEGDIIIMMESFSFQKPSHESIQALEDTVVHYISWEQLQYVYLTFPEFNFIGRVLTEKYYTLSEQRLRSIRMQKASERYLYIFNHQPELITRVPGKYLASYLDISRETLSRMRNGRRPLASKNF